MRSSRRLLSWDTVTHAALFVLVAALLKATADVVMHQLILRGY